MLAIKELLANKVKFGMIAAAIGLVVSLTMVTSAMSEGLITGMSGAKAELAADALVFQSNTYPTLERSILSKDDLALIAAAPGVSRSYGIGHSFATVLSDGESFDTRVFGLGDRLDQLPIVEGVGDLGPGLAIADISAADRGVSIGDTVELSPTGTEVTIVGFTEGRRYVMFPTLWVELETWESLYIATTLGRMTNEASVGGAPGEMIAEQFGGSATVAAIEFTDGGTLEDVQHSLGSNYTVVTPEDAARTGNGMPEMIMAVGGIQVVSIAIGALLVGLFFYITTLHKTPQIAAIKAIGASTSRLYRDLIIQITVLVSIAVVAGTALALAAGAGMPPMMAYDADPGRWGLAIAAIFATSYIGSLFSLRSILKIDPATALGRTNA